MRKSIFVKRVRNLDFVTNSILDAFSGRNGSKLTCPNDSELLPMSISFHPFQAAGRKGHLANQRRLILEGGAVWGREPFEGGPFVVRIGPRFIGMDSPTHCR